MKLRVATLLLVPVALATSTAVAQDLPEVSDPSPHGQTAPPRAATKDKPAADDAQTDAQSVDQVSDETSTTASTTSEVMISHVPPLAPMRASEPEPEITRPAERPISPVGRGPAAEVSAPTLNQPPVPDVVDDEAEFDFFSHGFRLGYLYLVNHDCRLEGTDPDSCVDMGAKYDVKRPHFFVLGYELTQRVKGSSWLNVLFVENILLSGLEQSLFLPSLNTLLGFELYNQVQIGVGVNLVPSEFKPAHMIMAIGWTPKVGNINVPIHFAFIPDVDNQHRLAATSGVNW